MCNNYGFSTTKLRLTPLSATLVSKLPLAEYLFCGLRLVCMKYCCYHDLLFILITYDNLSITTDMLMDFFYRYKCGRSITETNNMVSVEDGQTEVERFAVLL